MSKKDSSDDAFEEVDSFVQEILDEIGFDYNTEIGGKEKIKQSIDMGEKIIVTLEIDDFKNKNLSYKFTEKANFKITYTSSSEDFIHEFELENIENKSKIKSINTNYKNGILTINLLKDI